MPAIRDTAALLERVGAVLRRVIGAPDYDRYVAHVRTRHPWATPMTRDEFTRQRLADRYERPGARCC
ncbi:MAG TPA: YbdD/YjiX family protein [Gemmatimonadaceae bacterium]